MNIIFSTNCLSIKKFVISIIVNDDDIINKNQTDGIFSSELDIIKLVHTSYEYIGPNKCHNENKI